MGLSTKDVKVGGSGFTAKSFGPGNVNAKIHSLKLVTPSYKTDSKAYFVEMLLETPPIKEEGFEGFPLDSLKPDGKKHLGQVCTVKNGKFPFQSAVIPSTGRKIELNTSIMQFIQSICMQCDSTWLHDVDGKYDTIEELFAAFAVAKPFKDIFMDWCIAGDEYLNKGGYIAHYCHLAKWEKGSSQFTNPKVSGDPVLVFNAEKHIKALPATQEVPEFVSDEEIEDDLDFNLEEENEVPFNMDED